MAVVLQDEAEEVASLAELEELVTWATALFQLLLHSSQTAASVLQEVAAVSS